jgi:hypothetical protein
MGSAGEIEYGVGGVQKWASFLIRVYNAIHPVYNLIHGKMALSLTESRREGTSTLRLFLTL